MFISQAFQSISNVFFFSFNAGSPLKAPKVSFRFTFTKLLKTSAHIEAVNYDEATEPQSVTGGNVQSFSK